MIIHHCFIAADAVSIRLEYQRSRGRVVCLDRWGEGLKITAGGKISESEFIAARAFMTRTHSHGNFAFRSTKKKKSTEFFFPRGF